MPFQGPYANLNFRRRFTQYPPAVANYLTKVSQRKCFLVSLTAVNLNRVLRLQHRAKIPFPDQIIHFIIFNRNV